MDSKLVSMVRDLESEAERIVQEARDQAATIQIDRERSRARLAEEELSRAQHEAEQLRQSTRQKTQEEMERSRAAEQSSLNTLLHRGEERLARASKLILDRLGKL